MQIGALALWLAAWAARYGAGAPPQPVFSEHVDVSARIVTAATRAAHLGDGSVFGAGSMSAAGPDLARWATIAARASGMTGVTTIRVDGVDGGALPASDAVGAVSLASDPFSAATAGANDAVLDIATTGRTHWSLSGSPGIAALRARDPLAGGPAPQSRVRSISTGGPLGRAKRTSLSFAAATSSDADHPTYADAGGVIHIGSLHLHTSNSWSAGLTQSAAGVQFGVTAGVTNARDGAAGVGGEQGPSGALDLGSRIVFSRASVSAQTQSWTIHGATSIEARRDSSDAIASGRGIVFAGMLTAGAPDVVSARSNATAVRLRVTAAATGGRWAGWLAGVDASRDAVDDNREFNPHGILVVTSPGSATGTLIMHGEAAAAAVRSSVVSLFAERVAIDRNRVWLRGGGRLTRSPDGTTFDPRLTLGVNAGALLFGASAGLYTAPWPISVELERRFQHAGGERLIDSAGRAWTTRAAGTNANRRDGVVRLGVGHTGRVSAEIDQTWRAGWRLAGLTRGPDNLDALVIPVMVDTLDTTRQRRERDTHASMSITSRDWTAAAHYTFAVAEDNTDGPLALGPDPAAITPWAAAARVPRHHASLVATGAIGGGVRLLLSADAESGAVYSLATGADPSGLMAFTGLDGLRHAYRAGGSRDLSAYLARAVPVRRWGVAADAGLRLENLFNTLSPTAIAATSGSSRAGQAVSAGPGRSVSVWATLSWR